MKQLMRTFKQISILILAITLVGCEEDDAILPKVVAGFTYTLNADTGTVTFINISENSNTYVWDFGDDTSSKEINPIKTYPNGSYTVILTAKNSAGAYETFESTITINIPLPITLPITFDVANVDYEAATFNGAAFAIVDNPALGGSNNVASKVGAITNSGAAYEGINFDLGTDIDLAANKTIKMNFWSDKAITVLMKLEKGTASTPDVIVSHGGTGWEEMIFSFSSSSKYSRLTLFVDGAGTTAGTFYMDDVTQIQTPAPPCVPETAQSLLASDFNLSFQTDPTSSIVNDGGTFEWINNPDTAGPLNTSCKVGQVVRDASLQYANNQISFASPLDFTTKSGFKMKVWSPAVGTKVTVKLEGGVVKEVTKLTTKANEWEELTFDFAASVTGNNKIVLFFNIDSFTTGTFYFDDFMLYGTGSGGGGACTPDAAQTLNAADFNLTFSSAPTVIQDNATLEFVDNPGTSAVNNSCKVGKVTNSNVAPWDNIQIDLANKITFTDGSTFTMKIYSPQSGYKVTLKLEDKATSGAVTSGDRPSTTSTTKTNEWEELTFSFSSADSGKYDKIVLFFDLQTQNGNAYYFDDLKLNLGTGGGGTGGGGGGAGTGGGGIASNGDFETGTDSGWIRFQNGGTSVLDNTMSNGGGTWSGKLATNGASNPALKQEGIGIGTVAAGKTVTIKFDHKGAIGGEGGVFNVLLFGEGAAGASFTHVFNPTPVLGNSWATFTGTFAIPGGTDVSKGVSFLIETVCGGAAGCTVSANIDNVSVTVN